MTTRKATGRNRGNGAAGNDVTAAGGAGAGAPSRPPADDPDAIRADIETTRAELGDSVEALAAKADVKARAQETVTAAKDRAKDTAQVATERAKDTAQQVGEKVRRRPAPVAAVVAGLAAAASAVALIRRRRKAKTAAAQAHTRRWRRSRQR
jgi:Protein of unknown function (DUF3618)